MRTSRSGGRIVFESRPTGAANFRLSWATGLLFSRLGLRQVVLSSSSRTSRPPASASMSSSVDRAGRWSKNLSVSSVPHHDRDSRSRTCLLGRLPCQAALLGFPTTLNLLTSGVVVLDVFSELLHGKNGGPLNFWVPFSDSEDVAGPHRLLHSHRCLF
ncbi:hypothetical protein GWK47_033280 [Chionoecetes opilio]|uniref:Uncharacterized protein n=1 Tax=Chionoecetes opilio TaxID=41210 RepID=A0A8J4YI79_CHIOP|nr:hypothetical protein GWK47_033280 [Chionoecetes opilio]